MGFFGKQKATYCLATCCDFAHYSGKKKSPKTALLVEPLEFFRVNGNWPLTDSTSGLNVVVVVVLLRLDFVAEKMLLGFRTPTGVVVAIAGNNNPQQLQKIAKNCKAI